MPLACARGPSSSTTPSISARISAFVFLKRHRARFDLGKIQNVADQGEQRFARLGDRFGIGALFGPQLGFQQQPRHAQNAVHRRADLVTHGGEKARFCATGGLCLVARLGQRILQRLALGDVAPDALNFDQPAEIVAHGVIFPGDPAPAIGGAHMLVIAHAGMSGLQAGKAAEQRRAAVGMQLGRERLAERDLGIQAEQFEESVVGIGQTAVGGAAQNRIALRVHQALVALFTLIETGVHGGSGTQRCFQARSDGFELGGLLIGKLAAFARNQKGVQHKRDDHRHKRQKGAGQHDA